MAQNWGSIKKRVLQNFENELHYSHLADDHGFIEKKGIILKLSLSKNKIVFISLLIL